MIRCLYTSGLADRLRRKADITHELAAIAFARGDRDRGLELLRQFKVEDEQAKAARDHVRLIEEQHRLTARALEILITPLKESVDAG